MKKLLLLAMLISSMSVIGNQGTLTSFIKGSIVDSKTNEALPFCNVILERDGVVQMGTTTDFDGNYLFDEVPLGEYTLKVSYIGYLPQKIEKISLTREGREVPVKMEDQVIEMICCCFIMVCGPTPEAEDLFETEEAYQDSIDSLSTINSLIESEKPEVNIFPNPTFGVTTITNLDEIPVVYVAQLNGQILETIDVTNQVEITVDLQVYPVGIYLIMYPENGGLKTLQVVRK